MLKSGRSGNSDVVVETELANFVARITREKALSDGLTVKRFYEIALERQGAEPRLSEVSVEQFLRTDWWVTQAGTRHNVAPGYGRREQFPRCRFPALGGRTGRGRWPLGLENDPDGILDYYFQGGGLVDNSHLAQLPAPLPRLRFQPPVLDPAEAVENAIEIFLFLGQLGVVAPLFAAIWRTVLGDIAASLRKCWTARARR